MEAAALHAGCNTTRIQSGIQSEPWGNMQRREEHGIQEWHVLHTRANPGIMHVSGMDLKKPLPSQRRVACHSIYRRRRTPNAQHRTDYVNAMVATNSTYIDRWWCMLRCMPQICESLFHHPDGHLQKKRCNIVSHRTRGHYMSTTNSQSPTRTV
jgi:hypothetical protein